MTRRKWALPSRLFLLALFLTLPAIASAQDDEPPGRRPIGLFAADARLAFPSFERDIATADRLGVTAANLPGRGYGLVFGAHVYPLRMRVATLGIGGEVMASRGTRTLEPAEDRGVEGPTVRTRFSAISPQVSLNFGASEGWSYVSAGMGSARYSVEREDLTALATGDAPRRRTLNYGGGARWFRNEHLAFSIDLRFYSVGAQAATATRPDLPKMRRVVMSAGLSFK
jgi:hypothetical protein